jgi:hypothetical protein
LGSWGSYTPGPLIDQRPAPNSRVRVADSEVSARGRTGKPLSDTYFSSELPPSCKPGLNGAGCFSTSARCLRICLKNTKACGACLLARQGSRRSTDPSRTSSPVCLLTRVRRRGRVPQPRRLPVYGRTSCQLGRTACVSNPLLRLVTAACRGCALPAAPASGQQLTGFKPTFFPTGAAPRATGDRSSEKSPPPSPPPWPYPRWSCGSGRLGRVLRR